MNLRASDFGSAALPTSLIHLLEQRVMETRGYYNFLLNSQGSNEKLIYSDLALRARAIANKLVSLTKRSDSRALLLYPAGPDFLPAFFGCLYAGVIAIPVPPPDTARLKRALPRLRAIIADAEPNAILTTTAVSSQLAERLADLLPPAFWLATDTDVFTSGEYSPIAAPAPSDIAYLQYTSGSTSAPRGVVMTHANVLHNLSYLQRGFAYDADSSAVTWMPHFHDYGLVEGLLQPLYSNVPCHVLSPLTVIKRPLRWLQAIDTYRATHTHAPDFAYQACIRQISQDQLRTLDLSTWRVAGNGAEPVRADTMSRFADKFAPSGFRRDAFYPAYGLAEATLFVTARRHDALPSSVALDANALEQHRVQPLASSADDSQARNVVCCGAPQGMAELRIVDPQNLATCPPEHVGEIWVADPSVSPGYWRRDDETRATFGARPTDDLLAGPFLRTGDLGFIRNGDLYVTGRVKDLIIVGGTNHYPQDIEWTVQEHCPELRDDRCVAFSVDRGNGEQLVILAEPARPMDDWSPLFGRIRRLVAEHHDLSVAAIVLVERGAILRTSSGKLQRSPSRKAYLEGQLPAVASWQSPSSAEPSTPVSRAAVDSMQRWLCKQLAGILDCNEVDIDPGASFAEHGVDSRSAVAFLAVVEDRLGDVELSPTLLWRYPSIEALSRYLLQGAEGQAAVAAPAARKDEPLAIVGMACRFPGATSTREFWALLQSGRCAVGSSPRLPGITAGFIDDAEAFDAEFFGSAAAEAEGMDPQQRVLLEVAWEAIEDAGIAPGKLADMRAGVFIGISGMDHAIRQFRHNGAERSTAFTGTGVALSIAANRLSYQLNLRGPSMAIDTACSSSLVAVHQACQSLRSGESDLAVAGGVSLIMSADIHLALDRSGAFSPGRLCRTFDADADGYVRGEGCGVVLLKRLSDAERDGNRIIAVIRGTAVNQDGRSNGLMAPNQLAQQQLVRQALANGGVAPRDVDYVEAHGTGTRLGDPIEMGALTAVLSEGREPGDRCWIGSVKTNIGHLEAAAGIAGLMKTVLSLTHGEIPPHLHLKRLNPLLKLSGTPFSVPTETQPWPEHLSPGPERPRIAGVSSFGFGGTNAHVILEAAPRQGESITAPSNVERPRHVLALSGSSGEALRVLATNYAALIGARPDVLPADLCFSAATGRAHHRERLALVAKSPADLQSQLKTFAAGGSSPTAFHGHAKRQVPRVAFLFAGQGVQHLLMGRQLYETSPTFRALLDECDAVMRDDFGQPLLATIFGDDPERLNQTIHTQPAVFAIEYALAGLWRHWGVEPQIVIGHSLGEYAAACIAGVMTVRDGLRLVSARGRIVQKLPKDGAMLAVMADTSTVADAIRGSTDRVEIAAVNGPNNVVLSGYIDALEKLEARFTAAAILHRRLHISHAFHSPLLDPVLEEFKGLAAEIHYAPPQLTWISNVTGLPMTGAPDAEYWTRHLRRTVLFKDGIVTAAQQAEIFIDVGPRPVLGTLGAQCLARPDVHWLPSLHPERENWDVMAESLAQLYAAGVTPDWDSFDRDYRRRRVFDLPSYPFQRRDFALKTGARPESPFVPSPLSLPVDDAAKQYAMEVGTDDSTQPTTVAEWGHVPVWKPLPRHQPTTVPGNWVLVDDEHGVSVLLERLLADKAQSCLRIKDGQATSLPADDAPLQIVCLWGLDGPEVDALQPESLPSAMRKLVERVQWMLSWLAAQGPRQVRLFFVTRNAVAGAGDAGDGVLAGLFHSQLWGLGRCLRNEYPDWKVRLVDLDGPATQIADRLLPELLASDSPDEVRWRGSERSVLCLEQRRLDEPSAPIQLDGTWLVSGGLGRLGMLVAEWLVGQGVRHLMLLGRKAPAASAAERLAALAAQGTAILTPAVDITDPEALRNVLESVPGDWPSLKGVVHAAAVLDDGMLFRQSAERIAAVLAPKVLGGLILHRLTERLALSHFVLFSSAAGIFGNPGQAAYSAANTFLDGLAAYRRSRGLPANSLNWSAWVDAASDPRVARQLARFGVDPIGSEDGLVALGRALVLDETQLAILPAKPGIAFSGPLKGLQPPRLIAQQSPEALTRLGVLPSDARNATVTSRIIEHAAAILGNDPATIDPDIGFFEQGFDSMRAVELCNRLRAEFQRPVPVTMPFTFPTPALLAEELLKQAGLTELVVAALPVVQQADHADSIAIVAVNCRMPGGVASPEALWALLRDGVDAITEVPPDRWDIDAYFNSDPNVPGTIVTRNGGFVADVDQFDPAFFGISPREASQMDPQHRLLLEVCWELLERGGVAANRLQRSETGVFIGISTNDYMQRLNRDPNEIDAYLGSGNAMSLAANRLSYTFGFEGPSLAIDTACSSSLIAIHQACQSLRLGECEVAIAGGVNLLLDPTVSINHSRARFLSPDGRCKAFSAAADGMVRSEGCGLVLLKRLADARRDNDPVVAVIRGSAANQDGRSSGLTVPNGQAQERVIRRALKQAAVEPDAISYLEAHGTGTAIGDPIEAAALTEIFGPARREVALGSVKTNIGHLEAASGVAGLIKVVLSLQAEIIPATLHCDVLSPAIPWESSPLRVVRSAEPWRRAGGRYAGVSAFGFGGTNAHVVLSDAPVVTAPAVAFETYLLPLSAKTASALATLASRYEAFLAATDENLADICFTAACGRDHFQYRLAVRGSEIGELRRQLRSWLAGQKGNPVPPTPRQAAGAVARAGMPEAANARPQDWADLASRYTAGETLDWAACYRRLPLRKVIVPGHPFERQSYMAKATAAAANEARPYRLVWTHEAAQPRVPDLVSGAWLVLADRQGWGDALCAVLEERGAQVTRLYCRPGAGDPADCEPDDVSAFRDVLATSGSFRGVVHLWSLDSPAPADLDADGIMEAQRYGTGSVLALTQALGGLDRQPRLWLITQAAVAAAPGDRLEGVANAPLWGFGRCQALEMPNVWGGLLDLPAGPPTGLDALALCAALHHAGSDNQRALRDQAFLVPRLEDAPSQGQNGPRIRSDAAYLVSGGFGSLGREFGRWLVRQGARHLWILGRQGAAQPEAQAYLAELRALGASVEVGSLDIADEAALATQLAQWQGGVRRLAGVIHAAGLNADLPLADLDWQSCKTLLAPKVAGAWALHRVTAACDLDFFLNCSSIASVWGSYRQAAYGAANAFLDAFAAYRQAHDQAATSVNWGPLSDSTMLTPGAAAELRSAGVRPTPLGRASASLAALLSRGDAQVTAASIDWARFVPLYQTRSASGLFERVHKSIDPVPVESSAQRDRGNGLGEERLSTQPVDLQDWLATELSSVLRLPMSQLSTDIPLLRLGVDSLMAVAVRNRMGQQLGITVELPDLLGGLTLKELSAKLMEQTAPIAVPASPASARPQIEWVAGSL